MDEVSPKLRGTLPAAARAKMVHHRGYSGGRGDDPHGVTTPVATYEDSEEYFLERDMRSLGVTNHPDFDPNKSFLKKVED